MDRKSEKRPGAGCAVVTTNRNFRVTGWSAEAQALFGWSEGEARGRNIDELLRTAYAGGGFDAMFSSLLADGFAEFEAARTKKGGEEISVVDTVTLLRGAGGEVSGTVHVLRPADAPPAEYEPRERDRDLLDLLKNVAEDIWVYDMPANAQWDPGRTETASALGPPPGEETAGMVHPDDWERVDAAIREAIAEKMEDFRLQCRTMTPAGKYAWSLTQGRIRYDGGGKPERISGMTIDISDLKGAEERLGRRVRELEAKAQDVWDKGRLSADFSANASHEFKTPLSLLLMDLQLLEKSLKDPGADTEELSISAAAMRRNALKLLRLAGNLFDMARAEAGVLKARLVNTDVVALASGLVKSAAGIAAGAGVELSFESSSAGRSIPTDAEKLERVVLNLISNAIRHTPPGGHVMVRLRDAPGYVALSVKDDGEGIPEDRKAFVFERYKPAGAARAGGLGIGMPLSRALVELLRGKLWFDSKPGQGAEFFVALPVLQPDWPAPPLESDGMPRDRKVEMELSDITPV
jgi:PAS domain S-box-containing protein